MKILVTELPPVVVPEMSHINIDIIDESGRLNYLGKLTGEAETISELLFIMVIGARHTHTDMEVVWKTSQPSS